VIIANYDILCILNLIIMKLQNLLIYHVAKTALFLGAFMGTLIALIEITELFTGKTLSFGTSGGFGLNDGLFTNHSFYNRFMFLIPGILVIITLVYVCWQLGKMLHSIQKNKEFYEPNYKRLFNSGLSIIIVNILMLVIRLINNNAGKVVVDSAGQGKKLIGGDFAFSWSWVAIGCLLMILAKVFQRGSQLQAENDLAL
jgi:hypothetical protein